MMMKLTVTEKHIRDGIRGKPKSCPIALALCEAGYEDCFVGPSVVSFADSDSKLPKVARLFVFDFDHEIDVQPIAFELKVQNGKYAGTLEG